MFKDRVMVTNLKPSMWQEHHRYAIQKFIEDPSLKLMIAYMDQYRGFVIEFALPGYSVDQLTYFIKSKFVRTLTSDNFKKFIQYGSIQRQHIESLLRVMDGFYAPAFFENMTWPDNILFNEV